MIRFWSMWKDWIEKSWPRLCELFPKPHLENMATEKISWHPKTVSRILNRMMLSVTYCWFCILLGLFRLRLPKIRQHWFSIGFSLFFFGFSLRLWFLPWWSAEVNFILGIGVLMVQVKLLVLSPFLLAMVLIC